MGLFSKLRSRIRRLLGFGGKSAFEREDFWTDAYSGIILRCGTEAPGDTLANARRLGMDVEALIAEHERRKAASWDVEFNFDLAEVDEQDLRLDERLKQAGLPDREVLTHGRPLSVDVPDLHKRIDLPNEAMPMTRLVRLGIRAMQQRFLETSNEFPTNRFPRGASDWKLKSIRWSEGEQAFYLAGWWKEESRERKPSKMNPACSIDLRRASPAEKPLVSSRPFPKLEQITLSVRRGADGKHVVSNVFADENSSSVPDTSLDSDQPGTLRLTFPSKDLPHLEWYGDWSLWRTAATDFLQRECVKQAGKPADWLQPYSVEALIADDQSVPAADLRASLQSGPAGPAPLPKGKEWPPCPCCGELSLFSQSVDVRDISFADLLPGTSMVIFVCNDCLNGGEWQNCSSVIWLGPADEIVLVDRGQPAPLVQRGQWYASETPAHYDLPQEIQGALDVFEKVSGNPHAHFPPSYGTKVGGVPFYLQEEAVFYDRNGIVMEYIAQIATPEHIAAGGFGYISHSAATGETYIDFQDT